MVTFDPLPASGEMAVSALEAIKGRGLSQPMHGKLARPHSTVPCNKATAADPAPTCSAIAGKELSLIDVQLSGGSVPSANLTLTISVDPSVVKGRGGCYTTETKTLTICLAGWVGLHKYAQEPGKPPEWTPEAIVTGRSSHNILQTGAASVTISQAELRPSATWSLLTKPPCCDYNGAGAACGDQICYAYVDAEGPSWEWKPKILLGEGTRSKMPGVSPTNRPPFRSVADVDDATAFHAETPKPMKLRFGWSELCPEIQSGQSQSCTPGATQHTAMEWFPPRFGHAVKTVGTSTVLIFGGIGCSLWGETVNPGVNQVF